MFVIRDRFVKKSRLVLKSLSLCNKVLYSFLFSLLSLSPPSLSFLSACLCLSVSLCMCLSPSLPLSLSPPSPSVSPSLSLNSYPRKWFLPYFPETAFTPSPKQRFSFLGQLAINSTRHARQLLGAGIAQWLEHRTRD